MSARAPRLMATALAAVAVLGGCAAQGKSAAQKEAAQKADEAPFTPTYLGIDTVLMDNSLVDFRVAMKGARDLDDVVAYAKCAAAQYALIRGYGFARQIRTNVTLKGGVWRGDAVYTISPGLPRGTKTIDAEVTVRDCGEQGIPTV